MSYTREQIERRIAFYGTSSDYCSREVYAMLRQLLAECDSQKQRADKAEAELRTLQAECKRIVDHLGMTCELSEPWDSYVVQIFDGNSAELRRLGSKRDKAAAELADLKHTFDLQWKRMGEAVELWRKANPGNELVRPDLGELLKWFMAELARVRGLLENIQWSGAFGLYCPFCHAKVDVGHTSSCQLKQALAQPAPSARYGHCPHCKSELLASEDRGIHCDGCDDLTAEEIESIMNKLAQPAPVATVEHGINGHPAQTP